MGKSRRVFTREFKLAAVKEVEAGKPLSYVARQLEISANTLHRWHREFKSHPTQAFSGHGKRMLAKSCEAELERKIGQLTMENDFLKKLLKDFESRRSELSGSAQFTSRSRKKVKT